MEAGDIIEERALGRGLVIYLEEGEPVVAFPSNPELVLCWSEEVKFLIKINDL